MEKKFELFRKTLYRLGEAGVLSDIIMIGSWCLYVYGNLFKDADTIPAIRTIDLDFLIPNPPKIKHRANIPKILDELGFIEEFSNLRGNSKFIHTDLEVEFLIPEKGRGKDGPYIIKEIGIRAQGLRYVSMLQDNTITTVVEGHTVKIPEPAAFVLHKLQMSGKRRKKDKKIKDLEASVGLGEYLVTRIDQVAKLKEIYNSLPVPWRKEILQIARENSESIYAVLKQD